ncbi:beta-N-acetylhexosaminidase [Dictyobacter aurantiacus]|uniref:beta-N-acetylhexosaminidase n=1 Tax=Dictyobacter aurantiacus TaxID=1936993 RepID=A0A401ZK60_9CHLR|nr:beta-N-acetylhexosaminidase [Dictyobacter aurantiacus]GCE07204.1 beta-N-acetylhexosaminidase [Dictyobacter aurantiacus]
MHAHASLNHSELPILPRPTSVERAEGYFQLTRDTVIVAEQETQAIGVLLAYALAPALGFVPRVLTDEHPALPAISLGIDPQLSQLGQEGYTLTVTEEQVTLRAAYPAGVFYATQTLRQLLPVEIFSATPVSQSWHIPAVSIEDAPRFSWRGCMLDSARHFIPKQEVLKLIDMLALHKMNVLHLHLTDDQGWRIEIKKYPRLTEVGAYRKETVIGHARRPQGYDGISHGGFYSQQELREIVAYAAARYMVVVPEIDIPGHAQAAIAAYPELGVLQQPVEVSTTWGIHPYLFNPTEEVFQFLRDVLSEVMDIFPSPFIHIGGDEAIKDQWQASPQVQQIIKELGLKDEDELQSWFLSQIGTFLMQHNRRMLGWDEILEGGLPAGATVMSWRGIEGGIAAAQARHDVVMTPNPFVYLDYYQSNDPAEPLAIGGYLPLDKVYSFDPIPAELTAEQARHVLGAQCNLWSEYVPTVKHLEYMLFPRAIALAEVAWTPKERLEFSDFRQRLSVHEARLVSQDVNFRPVEKLDLEQTFPLRTRLW